MFEENPALKGPKCEECWPGCMPGNREAWEVFQRYSCPMGPDTDAIMRLAERMEIADPLEVAERVLTLLGEVNKNE